MNDDPQPRPSDTAAAETASVKWRPADLMGTIRSLLRPRANGSARAEIEHALAADEAEGAAFSPEERSMLRAVLKLGDLRVEDVMIPRADIDAVELETPIGEMLSAFREAGHSRMPVYRESLDDPVGMAHIKDIMAWIADTADAAAHGTGKNDRQFDLSGVDLHQTLQVAGIMRPILFVPPSMPARILLERMQASRTQMALVIDEYGGTDGLVSLEDLVEIIVGEIEDEHDSDTEVTVTQVGDGQFIADARAEIPEARKTIGDAFHAADSEADVDTIGGMIFTATGRVPVRGEILHVIDGYEIEILDADPRRIKKVRIRERRKPRTVSRARPRATETVPAAPGTPATAEGSGSGSEGKAASSKA